MLSKTGLSVIALVILIACPNSNKKDQPIKTNTLIDTLTQKSIHIDSNVIKVYIDKTGNIISDGKPITLAALDADFKKLSINHGMVYYSRDSSSQVPPPGAMNVMELIRKYALPVLLYSDKTFTRELQFD